MSLCSVGVFQSDVSGVAAATGPAANGEDALCAMEGYLFKRTSNAFRQWVRYVLLLRTPKQDKLTRGSV